MSAKKTVVIAAVLGLLLVSSLDSVFAQSPVLPLSSVQTRGPSIEKIAFSWIPNEATANLSLFKGKIQVVEGGFSSSVWGSLSGRLGITSGVKLGYTFDGIGFNALRPYANNPHFRRAMEYLTDYNYLQHVVNSGPGGTAGPFVLPCGSYPGACYQGSPGAAFNLAKAANELLYAGLVANVGGSLVCWGAAPGCSTVVHFTIQNYSLISAWYRHQNPTPGGSVLGYDCSSSPSTATLTTVTTTTTSLTATITKSTTTTTVTSSTNLITHSSTTSSTTTRTVTSVQTYTATSRSATWTDATKVACQFHPMFYYAADDPLRSAVALSLISSAARIGFVFDPVAIPSQDTGEILSMSAAAVGSPGVYNPRTGQNDPAPVFEPAIVNSSDPNSVTDNWDMYTFSLTGSPDYTYQARLFNSAFVSPSPLNFLNYYNATMDLWSNRVLYAGTASAARHAAAQVGRFAAQEAPYVMSFYEGTRWIDNTTNWTGFATIPTQGPNTGGGFYYTSLNAHPSASLFGGTLRYGLQSKPNGSGLDPLYSTSSLSQTDIWQEVYTTPLVTSPIRFGQANAFINYLTSAYLVNSSATRGLTSYKVNGTTFTKSVGCLSAAARRDPRQVRAATCPVTLTTGSGPGWFNTQSNDPRGTARIVNGTIISLFFPNGITWSDHVPLTAYDYNYSLYAWDVSSPPSLSAELTPRTGILSGPAGLWATHVVSNNRIDIYINSSSIWNIADVNVPVLPQHVFKWFDTNLISSKNGAVDTTLPYESKQGDYHTGAVGTCPGALCNLGTIPESIWYLPNLEVGSGPFVLQSFSNFNGSGVLAANPTFFSTAWRVNATFNAFAQGRDISVSAPASNVSNVGLSPVKEYIYNPTYSTFLGVQPLANGYVPIPNATSICLPGQPKYLPCNHAGVNVTSATYKVLLNGVGNPVISGVLACAGSLGYCHVVTFNPSLKAWQPIMPTATLARGKYEIVVTVTYNFLGTQRTWIEETGFSMV